MGTDSRTPGLDRIQDALNRGDIEGLRAAILELSDAEADLFAQEIGADALERTRRRARRARRGAKAGRVIVIHGIMGSMLDVVDPKGDADRVWLNAFRLAGGRIEDLELGPDEQNAKRDLRVVTAGMHRKTYVPLVSELDEQWDVRPFAFDWRLDVEHSADLLAAEVKAFGGGGPVHLVAHSMGGLVSRSMIRRHPDVWQSMRDGDVLRSGGRLVMLGTPNAGSFTIPLVLVGKESVVRGLAVVDLRHDLGQLLRILGSFTGSYQMLPSPFVDLGDDHARLFQKKTWGAVPVREALLEKARQFHEGLRAVIDPQRCVYVAGYDQKTPFRVQVQAPGKFELQTTQDGDGRVPHALGLLPDVATFWVDEGHGALPRNERVLAGIHELLQQGQTEALERTRPERRGVAEAPKWQPAEAFDQPPPGSQPAALTRMRSRKGPPRELTPAESIEIESWLTRDYLGTGDASRPAPPVPAGARGTGKGSGPAGKAAATPVLDVEVVWGDICEAEGDVYAVGHYQGVLPQQAELALDRVVSAVGAKEDARRGDAGLVITEHTRRGMLRGALGDVNYFPWGEAKHRHRVVAVAGMGYPGAFGVPALQSLIRALVRSVTSLPNVTTICSVLIGSGEGTLTVAEAVRGLVDGLAAAVPTAGGTTRIRTLRIVERRRDRAGEILVELRKAAAEPDVAKRVRLKLHASLVRGAGGSVSDGEALGEVLLAAHGGVRAGATSKGHRAVEALLEKISDADAREQARAALGRLEHAPQVSLQRASTAVPRHPTRISVLEEKGTLQVAAITETATVAERTISVDPALIGEIVAETNDPDVEPRADFATFLLRLLFPQELRSRLTAPASLVFEVDRTTAPVHWEMLAREVTDAPEDPPLGVQLPVARQLRTTYSPTPSDAGCGEGPLCALVVGDPGDPKEGDNLPGARQEAVRVVEILRERGVQVTALIGAPGARRAGLPDDARPATRVEVLSQLMGRRWDMLHYCGHGDFDPRDPRRAGWVFAGGLLTADEIGRLDQVPSLVVANACLSGRTSQALARGARVERARSEAGLLPSLADEFFHLGVRNYVGTSWEVNDLGAVLFAETLYEALLGKGAGTLGDAVQKARAALWDRRRSFGKLWAAYQHYGDPTARMWNQTRQPKAPKATNAPKAAPRKRKRKRR